MIQHSSVPLSIEELLGHETRGYQALVIVLQREADALAGASGESISQLIAEKADICIELQKLGAQRQFLFSASTTAPRRENPSLYEDHLTNSSASVAELWEKLARLAHVAMQRNLSNGRMVNNLLQLMQARIALMHSGTDAPQIYGPDGFSRTTHARSDLGAA